MILNLSEIAIKGSEYSALGVLLSEIEFNPWNFLMQYTVFVYIISYCVNFNAALFHYWYYSVDICICSTSLLVSFVTFNVTVLLLMYQ